MFLQGNDEYGDIVIDCGYTKCFTNMGNDDDGTFRYIQNIAGFTMNMESHIINGFDPTEWRPKAVYHIIDFKEKWEYPLMEGIDCFDIVFCIDATGSMFRWLKAAKEKTKNIALELKRQFPTYNFRFGAVFYRDPIKDQSDKTEYFQLTDDVDKLVEFMSTQKPWGGGNDGPEDWVSAYYYIVSEIQWRNNCNHVVIHIADDCAHGIDWGYKDDFPQQNKYLPILIRDCARKNIFISGIQIGKNAVKSFEKIKQIYTKENKKNLFSVSEIGHVDDKMAGNIIQKVTIDVISNISAF